MGRKRILRAVLDTNVLLGSFRRSLLLEAANRRFELVWSDYIESEMMRVMPRMYWSENAAMVYFKSLELLAERVDYQTIIGGNYDEWLKDKNDHPIMATALAGKVDYLVTNNTKDFPPKKRFAEITIITPDAFQRLLK